MKKSWLLACIFLLALTPLSAQETEDSESQNEETVVNEEDEFEYKLNQKGDQFLRFSIGGSAALNFPDIGAVFKNKAQLGFGGLFGGSYNYFVTENFILGAEVNFGFNISIGQHVFNYIPVILTATYQFGYKNFEFPVTAGFGMCKENFIGNGYFGIIGKLRAGAFYRLTPSWSLGFDTEYIIQPEFISWYDSTKENYVGQFAAFSIALRYHF